MTVLALLWLPVPVIPIAVSLARSLATKFNLIDCIVWAAVVDGYLLRIWLTAGRRTLEVMAADLAGEAVDHRDVAGEPPSGTVQERGRRASGVAGSRRSRRRPGRSFARQVPDGDRWGIAPPSVVADGRTPAAPPTATANPRRTLGAARDARAWTWSALLPGLALRARDCSADMIGAAGLLEHAQSEAATGDD